MELAIPLVALGGLYVISNNQSRNNDENIEGMQNNISSKRTININNKFENNNRVIEDLSNKEVDMNLINKQDKYLDLDNKHYHEQMYQEYKGSQTTDEFFNTSKLIEPVKIDKKNNNIVTNIGLDGQPINSNNFSHNNMQPFYREKILQNTNHDVVQNLLDNKIGSGSLDIQKKSNAPLFEPSGDMHYANGMPNMNDFLQSRVVPGNKISNVLPWDKKMVGPGLDQGYGTDGHNGFNSGMVSRDKWMPKDVNDLRVATNPKVSYSLDGHTGPANSHIKNRGMHATVEKNLPDRHYETNGKSSWFTTVGAETAPTSRALANVRSNIRENTSAPYEGIAKGVNKDNLGTSSIQKSRRIQLGSENIGIADAGGEQPATENNYGVNSYNVYSNNRTSNSQMGKYGVVGGALGAVVAPLMDMLRPSRKENVIGNVRLYGEVQTEVPASYINNPNDKLRTTNRQMLKDSDMYWNVQADGKGSYSTNSQPLNGNQRDTTQNYYVGNAGGDGVSNNMTTYDSAYKQNNNETKEILVQNRSNQGGTQIFNQNENVLISKSDNDRNNNRMWVPSNANAIPPSGQTYGKLDQPSAYFEEKTNYNRINPDLLNAFKQNPYTHSLNNSV